jgi:hypothetical protein
MFRYYNSSPLGIAWRSGTALLYLSVYFCQFINNILFPCIIFIVWTCIAQDYGLWCHSPADGQMNNSCLWQKVYFAVRHTPEVSSCPHALLWYMIAYIQHTSVSETANYIALWSVSVKSPERKCEISKATKNANVFLSSVYSPQIMHGKSVTLYNISGCTVRFYNKRNLCANADLFYGLFN